VAASAANVIGLLSLVCWSLTLVVTVKYVLFIVRADHEGEGGIYALLSLVPRPPAGHSRRPYRALAVAAMVGAALLYGDGIITPAISVLSAVEGLAVATDRAQPLVVPLTCLVLLLLFAAQRQGTARIGRVFGPLMLAWFAAIGALGLAAVVASPAILRALDPASAVGFLVANRVHGLVVMGAVVLCVTGGEALYADLGHFGRRPIRLSWVLVAFPALLLNYLGQGALLLQRPAAVANPFYGLVPAPLLYPMVALSTAATVIASQALISGVFSLTQQGMHLGYLPRLRIVHTSAATRGQIYAPQVNRALTLACLILVVAFGSSSRLAAAYGIAVTATMAITSALFYVVATRTWRWRRRYALPLVAGFLAVDLTFLGPNLLKVPDGGWVTLAVAAAVSLAMATWRDGRTALAERMARVRFPIEMFVADVARCQPQRVPGTAVFMTLSATDTPMALLHHFKHTPALHHTIVLLSMASADAPEVAADARLVVSDLGQGFFRVVSRYGYMERPSAPDVLRQAASQGLVTHPFTTTYFLGRENLLTSGSSSMWKWRKGLFSVMSRNAYTAPAFFGIPPDRVVEIGVQLEL
jgi:KUP system potassium uptake protein